MNTVLGILSPTIWSMSGPGISTWFEICGGDEPWRWLTEWPCPKWMPMFSFFGDSLNQSMVSSGTIARRSSWLSIFASGGAIGVFKPVVSVCFRFLQTAGLSESSSPSSPFGLVSLTHPHSKRWGHLHCQARLRYFGYPRLGLLFSTRPLPHRFCVGGVWPSMQWSCMVGITGRSWIHPNIAVVCSTGVERC